MFKAAQLEGKRFGNLVVLYAAYDETKLVRKRMVNKWQGVMWFCRCDCGERRYADSHSLIRGKSNCCVRCGNKKRAIKTWEARRKLYGNGMKPKVQK